jgi:hypothetical protein
VKKYLTAAALALLMTTAAYAKGNDFTILERKGNWTATYQVSNLGNPMCSVSTSWGNDNNRTATTYIKYVAGDLIAVQMYKIGWRMPQGTDVSVSMSFDDGVAYTATAKSGYDEGRNAYLQFRIKPGEENTFLNTFAEADHLKISFPDGDEPDWHANMIGSREVSAAFRKCAGIINKNAPTQPTGKAPTQPTGKATTQPTQPVKPTSPVKRKDDGSV